MAHWLVCEKCKRAGGTWPVESEEEVEVEEYWNDPNTGEKKTEVVKEKQKVVKWYSLTLKKVAEGLYLCSECGGGK